MPDPHATPDRVRLDRDELVQRVTRAYEGVNANESYGLNADYRDGYLDALGDTLDLLTGFVGLPVEEHRG